MNEGYKKRISYRFHTKWTEWDAVFYAPDCIEIEEVTKDYSRDHQMIGSLVLVDGAWTWEGEEFRKRIVSMYGNTEEADALIAFVNEHGPPPIVEEVK